MNEKSDENTNKCLCPTCDSPSYSRGLCQRCYNLARSLVKTGKTTWEQLQYFGKCLPCKTKAGDRLIWLRGENSKTIGEIDQAKAHKEDR